MPTNYNFSNKPNYFNLFFPNVTDFKRHTEYRRITNEVGYVMSISEDYSNLSPTGKPSIKYTATSTIAAGAVYLLGSVSPQDAIFSYGTPFSGVNESWTISFWAKSTAVKLFDVGLQGLDGGNSSFSVAPENGNTSSSWTFFSKTFVYSNLSFPQSYSNKFVAPELRVVGVTLGDIFWISDFSFTKVTDPVTTTSFDDQFIPADTFRQGNLLGSGWNDNNYGTIGDGTTISRSTPTLVFGNGSNWKTFSITKSAYTRTSAIKTDGTLWSWGGGVGNLYGGLGINRTDGTQTPVREFTSSTNWVMVSQGYNQAAAIKSDGTLWTWGSNDNGELGVNNTIRSWTPIQEFTSSSNWKYVNAATRSTYAIKTDGTLWGWGQNVGFLGTGDNIGRTTPVQIGTDNKWKMIDSAQSYSFAVKTDGTLWWWGRFEGSQLGFTNLSSPVQYDLDTDWKIISNSAGHVMGIKNSGEIWGWGRGDSYQLGLNSTSAIFNASLLHRGDWRFVHASQSSTFAISSDGTLWGWGANSEGKLGLPQGNIYSTPTIVNSSKKWKMVQGSGFTANYISYIDPII